MRILNVIMSLDPVSGGGTAERTFQVSRQLVKAGAQCSIFTLDLGLRPERLNSLNGVDVIAPPCLNNRFYIPKCSFELLHKVIANVDVVHLMNHWTVINALVYRTCRKLNKPYVICPAGALPIYGRSRSIKKLYNWVIGKRIIRNANGHVAIGTNEIDQFHSYGIKANQVTLIPNGINAEDFQADETSEFRKKFGLGNNPFIMFMGRLNVIKGPDLLLRAFCNAKEKLQKYHLLFVGPDGGMLLELKKMAAEFRAAERVHFLGYLDGVDKSQAYYAADLLIIPSRKEAMSIVVLEAGITGTPVLLTDQCGFDEIAGIKGGYVVPATVSGIENGLVNILQDHDRLKSMGANLKKYTYENFTWDLVIDKYLKLYRHILGICTTID